MFPHQELCEINFESIRKREEGSLEVFRSAVAGCGTS